MQILKTEHFNFKYSYLLTCLSPDDILSLELWKIKHREEFISLVGDIEIHDISFTSLEKLIEGIHINRHFEESCNCDQSLYNSEIDKLHSDCEVCNSIFIIDLTRNLIH